MPRGYDLVFSRDSLQHLPMHGTWQFLNNVKASGAKYLLVGSYIDSASPNGNIRSLATGEAPGAQHCGSAGWHRHAAMSCVACRLEWHCHGMLGKQRFPVANFIGTSAE